MSTFPTFTIRWVDSVDAIPHALWEACFPPPLEGRWWYATLHGCGITDQFTFAYAVIERAGEPVGVAPTFVMDVPLDVIAPDSLAAVVRFVGRYVRFLRYQRTLFVGSPCSDEGTVGLLPGVELSDVADSLQSALNARAEQAGASMIVWKDFSENDLAALKQMAAEQHLFEVVSFPGTRVPLPGGGYEAYLKSLTSSHRHNLKKKLRRGQEAIPTTATVVRQPGDDVLAEIWPLFWQTYLKGKTKFEKLNPTFFKRIAAEPASHFVMIRRGDDQTLVAFMLCFDCRPRVINKFIGIDYSIEHAYLYFQLWDAAVRWAADERFEEMQSGQTGYRAKLDVGHTLVPLTNLCQHRNPLVHRLFAWQAKSIGWASLDHDLKVYLDSKAVRVEKLGN